MSRILAQRNSRTSREVGGTEMELAKIAKGQVTIPINVRKKLILKEGDKLILKKMATWRLRTLP